MSRYIAGEILELSLSGFSGVTGMTMTAGRKALGFYWTLPVPWAGFTKLPDDINEAAKASHTIRYQMEAIRSYAKDNKLDLIREQAFIELQPDRGTTDFLLDLKDVASFCREQDCELLYVDFSEAQGWRSHAPLTTWFERNGIRSTPVCPGERMIDGRSFDPREHFRQWREWQHEWAAGKQERVAIAYTRADDLRAQNRSNAEIAAMLNQEGLRSATGKPWTGEMVRKLFSSPPPR